MCGIAGIIRWRREAFADANTTEVVERMTTSMVHRGPDASGVWTDHLGRCVLGHRRLSIIDTSDAGRQPMATADGRWLITFNGEIYNFQELRPALEAAGIHLRGRTDTEVLIEGVAHWGAELLPKLDGMFAFAAFDTKTGELLLARDPFGEKPLYYMELNGGLAFASELQALEQVPGFDGTVNVDAMAEVLAFQYIGAPRCIYRSVKKLPPASWLRVDADGRIETGSYFEFRPGLSGLTERPLPELVDELEDILTRSIRRRLISDVPLGAFLSGGVDSSVACALIRRKLQLPLKTFSIGFDNAPESEHVTARAFGQHLGTEHYDEILTPNTAQFLVDIGKILDEPNADSSCLPTYLLSRFARRQVTVAVSGDGGDEMFGGYGRYFSTLEDFATSRAAGHSNWKPGSTYFGNRILVSSDLHIEELFSGMPPGYAHHVARLRTELDDSGSQLLNAMRRSDVDNYLPGAVLPKVDRMSMRHSLEVRTPYLNTELARFAERLPDALMVQGHRGKIILRELAYRYLPKDLIDLPKMGFGLPMSDWARTTMLEVAGRMLESEDSHLKTALGSNAINRFLSRQRTPGQFSIYQVWAVAMLESWLRNHPAQVPQIAETKSTTQSGAPGIPPLQLVKIGDGKFLITRRNDDDSFDFDVQAVSTFLSLEEGSDALGFIADNQETGGLPFERPRRFPEWGEPLSVEFTHALSDLQGGTVLFIEADALQRFDYHEYYKFRKLGVKRLVFRIQDNDDELYQIDIRYRSRSERASDLLRLFSKRTAIVSNSKRMKLLRAKAFKKFDPGVNVSRIIRKIDPFPDTELRSSFMLFEGTRQLPPTQATHLEIATRGKGRYSIWNQTAVFSPTDETRIDKPFWLVPLTPETEPLLPMRPRMVKAGTIDNKLARSEIETFLCNADPASFVLKRGDRVVLCTHALPPGGAERQWVYLAQALSDAGFDVHVVTYRDLSGQNSHYLPLLKASNIPHLDASKLSAHDQIHYLPRQREAALLVRSNIVGEGGRLLKLAAALKMLSPKVVFAQLDEPNILAGFATHLADVPRIVMSFRNYNPSNFPYIYNDWFLSAYRLLANSKRVLFSGNHEGANRDYANWIGIAPERVACVHNAINTDIFPEPTPVQLDRARSVLGVRLETPVVLGVFRLSAEKDPLTFLEVCGRVLKHVPDLRVFVVGVGSMRETMDVRAMQLGLTGHLQYLERRSDVNVLMGMSSLLLLTSVKEGMPNVVLEAQLLGKPVVATNVGAISEIVADGETGLLCPVADVDGLSAACIDLLSNPVRARKMGESARRRVATTFDRHKMAQRYVDLVNAVESTRLGENRANLQTAAV